MRLSKVLSKVVVFSVLLVAMFSIASFTGVDAKKHVSTGTALYEKTVTIENKNTKVSIGFVKVHFKKDALEDDMYPITFDIKLYQEDGEIYIEFSPDVEEFFKDVNIQVYAFEGFIYDVTTDSYVYVEVPNFSFKVSHFSRYCFVW